MFQQYATYNIWASERLIDCIVALPDDWQVKEVPSSYSSLYGTLIHIWDAESIWWQRMKMQEAVSAPSKHFKGTTKEISTALLQQSRLWEVWISNATLAAIEHVFHYQNTKREHFRQPIYQMLLHLFNHGTYHRGQLVNILRQLGVTYIPATDFIVWSRRKSK